MRIQEVEKLGGMAKAIETGIPKMRIEEAAARKQARIDSGNDTIVGDQPYTVSKRRIRSTSSPSTIRLSARAQIKRLNELRANRDEAKRAEAALAAITECVPHEEGELCSNWPSKPPKCARRSVKSRMPAKRS